MAFIGIIGNNKDFNFIKKFIVKNINRENLNIINITKENICNIDNVKIENIVINEKLNKFKEYGISLNKILNNCKYIVVNSDMEIKDITFPAKLIEFITYGLNQKSTITISSITDENILMSIQRNITNKNSDIIEVQEKNIFLNNKKVKVYSILILYTIFTLYSIPFPSEI